MKSRFASRFNRVPEIEASDVGRPRFRFRNPIVEGMLEIITQPLYDYYEVAANTVTSRQVLFTIPVGQQYTPTGGAAFNKNRVHTNLVQASQLQAPNKHLTRAVAVVVHGATHFADLNNFLHNTLLTFSVNDKVYLEQLVARCPAGGGSFVGGIGTLTAPASLLAASNGWPDARNLYALEHEGVQIEQQQAFAVVLDPTQVQGGAFTTQAVAASPSGTTGFGIRAWVYLDGTLARAVQ